MNKSYNKFLHENKEKPINVRWSLYVPFQPDISEYSTELLPLLFKFMSKAEAEGDKDPRALVNSYYALEQFCENLGQY